MPYSYIYYFRLRRIHDKIYSTRATPTSKYGRQWMRVLNALRYQIGYALPRHH
jgi:hypothetical protein